MQGKETGDAMEISRGASSEGLETASQVQAQQGQCWRGSCWGRGLGLGDAQKSVGRGHGAEAGQLEGPFSGAAATKYRARRTTKMLTRQWRALHGMC